MTLLLNPDELQQLTDRVQPTAQARVLRAMGVNFLLHPNGHPKVLRSQLELRAESVQYLPAPDLAALDL